MAEPLPRLALAAPLAIALAAAAGLAPIVSVALAAGTLHFDSYIWSVLGFTACCRRRCPRACHCCWVCPLPAS
ncbi:MAG: hypothetical protein U1E15_12325 [Hyphomicrobiales bacterium]